MIRPVLWDEALLADIREADQGDERFRLWWFGQSGFLLQYQHRHLLFDPYLSDSLTRKYANTDKPHVRMTQIPISPERLDFVDVVTSSHNHTDHLDAETLVPLLHASRNAAIVVPEANRPFVAERLGVPTERLTAIDAGAGVSIGPFAIQAVPAAHETIERDEQGRCRYLGYVVRFGPWTVYHSGDTVRYDGMAERLAPLAIDLMLLPINGRLPSRRVAGNLWGRESAQLASDARARLVIPCHYEMFEFNTVTTDEFVDAARSLGQRHQLLRCGERWTSGER